MKTFFLSIVSFAMLGMIAGCSPKESSEIPETSQNPETSESVPETSTSTATSEELSLKEKHNAISIKEAIDLANSSGEEGSQPTNVYGFVDEITNPKYGKMNLKDGNDILTVYGVNKYVDMDPRPVKGDEIVLKGVLHTFKGEPELGKSDIVEFIHTPIDIDLDQYKSCTINDARNSVPGTKVKLEGIVGQVTFTQSMVANGYYLIDGTNSIFIYDKDNATFLKQGNKVTIVGERANYISSKETENASKFGYTGCIQISNTILINNDHEVHELDLSWASENTVKNIVNMPTETNNTTTIYKVKGIINRVDGGGFINYYINDIDNKTGSYVYTSNSGKDFAWLDKFDGKFVEIYLSPINAKATSSGIVYRLIPIKVTEIEFTLKDELVPEFVLEYYVVDNFEEKYSSDPILELETNFANELLNYNDVKVKYESSDNSMVEFVVENNKTIMHVKASGNPKITLTATYKTYTATRQITLTLNIVKAPDANNVKFAIDAAINTEVTVKGIVMSSLVNQIGFYLADETGIIAVRMISETLEKIELGNEVYVKGTRAVKGKSGASTGNACILDAELLFNAYGKHEYSTASFDTTSTLKDIINLPVSESLHTTKVFVVKGKIKVEKSQYSINYSITSLDEQDELSLYSGGKTDYEWLNQFINKEELTIELALCNWNSKAYFKGCVVSVNDGTNKVINERNFIK